MMHTALCRLLHLHSVISVVTFQLQLQLQSYFFSFRYFFQSLFQLFDISVTFTVIM